MDHPVVVTFLIFVVIAFLSLAAEVLRPLALAVLLAFALAPLVRLLERLGAPRSLAAGIAVMVMLLALGGVGYVVGRQLVALADQLPRYEQNIYRKLERIEPREKTALDRASEVAS